MYVWQDGSINPVFTTTEPMWVVLTISNACGSAIDSLLIEIDTDGPQLDLGNDVLACEGEIVEIESGITGVAYAWNDGSTEPSLLVTQSDTIALTVTNACGMDVDSVIVGIYGLPPVVWLGPDTLLCNDGQLLLMVEADPETTIEWQDGSTGSTFIVEEGGSYFLQAANRCGQATDTILVQYAFSPSPFSLGPDTVICDGEEVILQVPHTHSEWQWSNGSEVDTFCDPGERDILAYVYESVW